MCVCVWGGGGGGGGLVRRRLKRIVRSFCFCLMSSDAKSILGTISRIVYVAP